MAACPEVEEKTSSLDNSVHFNSFFQESVDFTKSQATNKFDEESRTGDLTTLSDDEFLHLLKEASTFNKPNNQESVLLKQLRKEVAETELRENVNEHTEHKHSKIIIYNSSTATHKTFDGKKKNRCKEDSKNALNSDKTVLQSLSLQDLLNPETKTKKSYKAQRTLSLSSEEAAAIVSDSFCGTSKISKKSNKLSNSKNDSTKSIITKSNSKGSSHLGGPSTSDSGQKRKYEALVQNSTLPYETLINECDIPLPDEPRPEDKSISASVVEIDIEELKSKNDKSIASDSKVDSHQSSSKFYVDSSDVDATVAFPLQLVSSMENGPVNFPLVPWPRPVQVQTLLGVPLDVSILTRSNEKQLLNADINGNPFSRTSRPSLASFVSTTLLDYNNSNLLPENKNRKNKRLRNAVNKGVLSENIAGHRGEEDIDTLLQYINSSDKKGKTVKGNSPNQMLGSKSIIHESDRKKSLGKEIKSNHKNMIVKKKLSRSNSLENLVSECQNQEKFNSLSYESNAILDKPLKNSKSACFDKTVHESLDINSNVELPFDGDRINNSSLDDESVVYNLEQSSSEVSSFAADFYSTSDVSSQTIEETGFLIVKKKGRKKRQGKRSESYRWRTTQAQRKKGMMIPLAESKCGKQDSRRKSTSSVPHSEHSSVDNSDLDSVHSLPVRGSVPHPTQPHPHTTPSSSSSTPQASYADIARMPIPKLNSSPPCIMTYSASAKPQTTPEQDLQKADSSNLVCVKRKASDVRENKNHACLSMANDGDNPDVKIRSEAKSTREINTQTEPVSSQNDTKSEKAEEPCKTICSTFDSCPMKKNFVCVKSRQKFKSNDIPPVIMDNMPAESDACNISFGFGVEEVLQMTPDKEPSLQNKSEILCSSSSDSSVLETVGKESCCSSSQDGTTFSKSDFSCKASSHLQTVCYGTGRNICYSETKVNAKKFNLSEITHFLGSEFKVIENELDISKTPGSKIMYYVDSAEEA